MSSTFSSPRPSRSMSHGSLSSTSPSLSSSPDVHPRPPSPSPHLPTPTVTLIVGGPTSPSREPHPTKFMVPTYLLTSCSPFFAACLGSPTTGLSTSIWTEARTGVIHLPTERVEDVGMLVKWLESESGMQDVGIGALGREGDGNGNEDVTGDTGLKLWRELRRTQPGLRHDAIDGAVEGYLDWKCEKLRRKVGKKERKAVEQETGVEGVKNVCHGSFGNVFDPSEVRPDYGIDLPEIPLDTSIFEVKEAQPISNSTTLSTKHDDRSSCTDTLAFTTIPSPSPRPPPPVLGPLIRLYILADKYDIGYPITHHPSPPSPTDIHPNHALPSHLPLRHALTLRLKTIHTLTHTVPNQEDVARLWSSIPVDVLGEEGMKAEIVRIFVGIRGREVGRVFADESWDADFLRRVLVGRAEREREMEKRNEVKDVKQG